MADRAVESLERELSKVRAEIDHLQRRKELEAKPILDAINRDLTEARANATRLENVIAALKAEEPSA
jgi:hypothetical protein